MFAGKLGGRQRWRPLLPAADVAPVEELLDDVAAVDPTRDCLPVRLFSHSPLGFVDKYSCPPTSAPRIEALTAEEPTRIDFPVAVEDSPEIAVLFWLEALQGCAGLGETRSKTLHGGKGHTLQRRRLLMRESERRNASWQRKLPNPANAAVPW